MMIIIIIVTLCQSNIGKGMAMETETNTGILKSIRKDVAVRAAHAVAVCCF